MVLCNWLPSVFTEHPWSIIMDGAEVVQFRVYNVGDVLIRAVMMNNVGRLIENRAGGQQNHQRGKDCSHSAELKKDVADDKGNGGQSGQRQVTAQPGKILFRS